MIYDFERAPPAFTDCVLNRLDEFKTAQLSLGESLNTERKRIDESIKQMRRSNTAGRSEVGLKAEAEKMKGAAEKELLEKVTTAFIDTLWPTTKWANNGPRKDVREFFEREIQAFGRRSDCDDSSPTKVLERLLLTIAKQAQKQIGQKKEELKPQQNESSIRTSRIKNFRFYDLDRAPPDFTDCVLNRFEEFKRAQLSLGESLKTERKRIDECIRQMRQSNTAGRSEVGLKAEAEKMKGAAQKELLEKVTTAFIDTLWPTIKWANNGPRKDVREFFEREIQAFGRRSDCDDSSPTEVLERLLSTIIKEAQNQLKPEK